MTTRVTLVANTYTSLEAVVDALGSGEIVVRSDLPDLDIGLVTATQTPTALPEVNDAGAATRILKPLESTLEVWAYSLLGGDIYVSRTGNAVVFDTTGVTSA